MSDWLDKRPTYASKATTIEIEGQAIDFYPVSGDAALMLKAVARPIARILAFITSPDGQKDQHFKQVVQKDAKTGEEYAVVETQPISLDLAQYRARQRAEAIDQFINDLMSEEVRTAIGCVIIDSMRPREDDAELAPARGAAFARKLDLSVLKQYLSAVAKANGALFGPLAGQAASLKEAAAKILAEKVASLGQGGSQPSPAAPAKPDAASPTTPPTEGTGSAPDSP